MKLLIIFLVLGWGMMQAMVPPSFLAKAFQTGKTDVLANHWAPMVYISIGRETGGRRPARQAQKLLDQFFQTYPPVRVQWLHRGQTSAQQEYWIARYRSTKKTFRVFVTLERQKQQVRIQQIRIIPDE